jgi:hypothetical protein
MGIKYQMKTIWLNEDELAKIRLIADREDKSTRSKVHPGGVTNSRLNKYDQFTGNAGEAALSKYLTGSIDLYLKTKQQRELSNWTGDYSSDLLGLQVDVKTSRMRRGPDFDYHLWIRNKEYHQGTKYVMALMPEDRDDQVILVGWIKGTEIHGLNFQDRREVISDELHSL